MNPQREFKAAAAGVSDQCHPRRDEEHPGERLALFGAGSLTDAELVAVILEGGQPGPQRVALAKKLLANHHGLAGLLNVNYRTLRHSGLSRNAAANLLATMEYCRRLASLHMPTRDILDRPDRVANYLLAKYCPPAQEVFGALFLDVRDGLIAESEICRGTVKGADAEPRGILEEAILCGASRFVLFHNHPSGEPLPSSKDLSFTQQMAAAGEIIGIGLADHLIIGSGRRWMSLKRRGFIGDTKPDDSEEKRLAAGFCRSFCANYRRYDPTEAR